MKTHELLRKHLIKKQKINPRYSLRSLARDLKMSSSFLSRLFNGKQPIPPERIDDIVRALAMDSVSENALRLSMAKSYLRQLKVKGEITAEAFSLSDFEEAQVTQQELRLLSPWYNIALLDFVTCVNFKMDITSIARRFSLKPEEINDSFRFLQERGYISNENGTWSKTNKKLRLPTRSTSPSIRAFHKSLMERAVRHMNSKTNPQDFEDRLITSATIAVNANQISEAKQLIAEFQARIIELLTVDPCHEVYALGIQFFPLSK